MLVGLFGLAIDPLQGLCLHRTAQSRKKRTLKHVWRGIWNHES